MTTTMPSRAAIESAGDIDFNATRSEKQANIRLTAGPNGLTITIEWTGPVSGIPAAIERLRAAGVLELVTPARAVHTAALSTPKAAPFYDGDGSTCCPTHKCALKGPNQWGKLYCSAKDGETYCKYTWKAE